MFFKIFALVFAISSVTFGSDCDVSRCPIPKHYEELGCKPVKKDGECCPQSFDCTHLETRDRSKCYYKGSTLKVGEMVDASLLKGSCTSFCSCAENRFICAQKNCAENFGPHLELGCVRQYSNDECCSTGVVCGDNSTKLATCDFEGKTYKEGERMQPQDHKCHRCLCVSGFDATKPVPENTACNKISCEIELFETDSVKDGCIPSYHPDSCCPYSWRCPAKTDAIIPANQEAPKDPKSPKCKFGKLLLEIGDTLSKDENGCSKCTCKQPPMVECVFSGCQTNVNLLSQFA